MRRVFKSAPVAAIAVFVIAAALAGCSGGGGGGKKVLLEATSSAGPDAFTTSVSSTPAPSSTVPATLPPTTVAAAGLKKVSGVAPGLYGGTRDSASCDVEQMVTFMGANPGKAQAWAQTEGITVDQIPEYVRGLTPVVLRADTRVTNHGFAGGKATPRQAVLQAGTAVLVDKTGVPRAKCACGNPLLPPAQAANASFTGAAWSGFKATETVAVNPGPPVDKFTLVDPSNGQQFSRPVGGTGSSDTPVSQPTGARQQDRTYTGIGAKPLPDIDLDVPFIVSTPYQITANSVSGYFETGGNKLNHAGHYGGLIIQAPEGASWTVIIRPLGPSLLHKTGTGDTKIGTLSNLPDQVVIEFKGSGAAGNSYVSSDAGVLSSFTAEKSSDLTGLEVADHQNAGWTLDIWGVPPGCGYSTGTENSVKCA
jgi:Domain of unknown function (DUF6777)